MADDIHMTTLLPSLTAAAQIRRVKPTDPHNERRTPGQRRPRDQKRKRARQPMHDSATRDQDGQKRPLAAGAEPGPKAVVSPEKKRAEADKPDRTIDIRV